MTSKPLSLEDLSLFDTLSSSSKSTSTSNQSNSKYSTKTTNGSLLLDLFSTASPTTTTTANRNLSSPSSVPKTINNNNNVNIEDDDEFGEFIENNSNSNLPSTNIQNLSSVLENDNISSSKIQQQQQQDDEFGDFEDFSSFSSTSNPPIPATTTTITSSSPPKTNSVIPITATHASLIPSTLNSNSKPNSPSPKYHIQAQINELSNHDPSTPIKFGQHIESSSNQNNSNNSTKNKNERIVDNGSSSSSTLNGGLKSSQVSTPKWENIISARAGPSSGIPNVSNYTNNQPSNLDDEKTNNDKEEKKKKKEIPLKSETKPPKSHVLVASHQSEKSIGGSIPTYVNNNVEYDPNPLLIDTSTSDSDTIPTTTTNTNNNNNLNLSNPLPILGMDKKVDQPQEQKQQEEDDEWSTFQEFDSTPAPTPKPLIKKQIIASSSSLSSVSTPIASSTSHSLSLTSRHSKQKSTTSLSGLPPEYQNIPSSTELLTLLYTKVLRLIEPLFASLVPLSYSLKKRVLNNSKTRDFLFGYFETLHIVARILAGRHRRLPSLLQTTSTTSTSSTSSTTVSEKKIEIVNKCDREARELERVWKQEISPRLRAANISAISLSGGGNNNNDNNNNNSNKSFINSSNSKNRKKFAYLDPQNLDLDSSYLVSKRSYEITATNNEQQQDNECILCGLEPHERIPYLSSSKKKQKSSSSSSSSKSIEYQWQDDSNGAHGHISCLKFWTHKSNYGL